MSSTGKRTEKKLTKKFKELMTDSRWWFHRFPDAGVCRGRIEKQPADYMVMYEGVSALVEAKECESLTSIPLSRLTQTAKMRRFEMAGGVSCFIISHPHDRHDKWKWQMFGLDDLPDHRKSVDLTKHVMATSLDGIVIKLKVWLESKNKNWR